MITCCFDEFEFERNLPCADSISEDLGGDLVLVDRNVAPCARFDRDVVTTKHMLRADVTSHPCTSGPGVSLDGSLTVLRLRTVFEGDDRTSRGAHTGVFIWQGSDFVIGGDLSGITNAGLVRAPLRKLDRCDQTGLLVGRLCGHFSQAPALSELDDALVLAEYRMELKPHRIGGDDRRVTATVEGVILRSCPPAPVCVDFASLETGANPRRERGLRFQLSDSAGFSMPRTEIVARSPHRGLLVPPGGSMLLDPEVELPSATFTVVKAGGSASMSAYGRASDIVTRVHVPSAAGQASRVVVSHPDGVDRVVVENADTELLILEICTPV